MELGLGWGHVASRATPISITRGNSCRHLRVSFHSPHNPLCWPFGLSLKDVHKPQQAAPFWFCCTIPCLVLLSCWFCWYNPVFDLSGRTFTARLFHYGEAFSLHLQLSCSNHPFSAKNTCCQPLCHCRIRMPFLYDASASWNLLVDFESLAIITFHFLPFTKDFFFFFLSQGCFCYSFLGVAVSIATVCFGLQGLMKVLQWLMRAQTVIHLNSTENSFQSQVSQPEMCCPQLSHDGCYALWSDSFF